MDMTRVGFEPTPFRTRSLVWRLRPLGHLTMLTFLQSSHTSAAMMPLAEDDVFQSSTGLTVSCAVYLHYL